VPVGITTLESSILYVMPSQTIKNQFEIWSITLDGSSDQFLTVCTLEADDHPKISPNGEKVLYQRDHNIWIMNIDGSEQVRLTDFPSGHLAYHGQYSPSGSHIVYIHRMGKWGAESFIEWVRPNGQDFARLSERHNIVLSEKEIQPNNNFRFWPVFQP
jgi:Tol biopolymer transport system component